MAVLLRTLVITLINKPLDNFKLKKVAAYKLNNLRGKKYAKSMDWCLLGQEALCKKQSSW
jgi:hypothetical protein